MARSALRNRIEYWLYRAFSALTALLPRRTALELGARLGRLLSLLMSKRRRRSDENLRLAFPELTSVQRSQIVREMFEQLGRSSMELLRLEQFHRTRELGELFEFHGLEQLRDAYGEGKGVILLTAHLGFWEAGTMFLPRLGFATDFIAKKMKNPLLDEVLTRIRCSSGGDVLDSRSGARRILRSLAAGHLITILPDQRVTPKKGVLANFFGRPAWTTPAIAQIAMKTSAPVVPGFVERLPDLRYKVTFLPAVHFAPSEDAEAVLNNTQTMNEILETAIRRTPAQWFWLHDRWRP